MQWPITCRVGRLVKSVLLVAVVLLGIWATSTGLCLTGLVLAARAFGPTVGQLTKPIHFQYSASTATAFAALHSEELAKVLTFSVLSNVVSTVGAGLEQLTRCKSIGGRAVTASVSTGSADEHMA